MKIGAPKETFDGEKRVAMTPQSAAALKKLGYDCLIEAGAGDAARFSDASYAEAGVDGGAGRGGALGARRDIVAKVRAPSTAEVGADARRADRSSASSSRRRTPSCCESLAGARASPCSPWTCVPRISRAQKMDALSSMANIAGYRAVIEAAQQLRPLLHRADDRRGQGAAGQGAVVGAGVAGLAAIGTAVGARRDRARLRHAAGGRRADRVDGRASSSTSTSRRSRTARRPAATPRP